MNMLLGIVTATPDLLVKVVANAVSMARRPLSLAVHANAFQPDIEALKAAGITGQIHVSHSPENIGVTKGFHKIWEMATEAGGYDLINYQHDDVDIYEHGWDERVIRRFESTPLCAVASFNGASGLAVDDIYRIPYRLQQLQRFQFMSNMRSAEAHGLRVRYERPIATFDSFSMIVRKTFLDKLEGWAWYPYPCHNIDNSLACQVRRHGMQSWLVPVDCEHHGGRTSTTALYQNLANAEFGGDVNVHAQSHEWLYEQFRDVLPIRTQTVRV